MPTYASIVLFSLLSLLVPATSSRAEIPAGCLDVLREYAKEKALQVSCNISEITKKLMEGKEEVVPAKIYHFGKREYMLQNAEEGNIPADVWKNIIMGEKERRFELSKLRRGLYGTHVIDSNSFYDPRKYDWLMEIHIKEECRVPARVA